MRQVEFKTTDDQIIQFNSSNSSIQLDQEQPYGVNYRGQCSSTLTEQQLNSWWDYVDELLVERPTSNFHSIWKIIDNGTLYGYEN
jgi:hypothetical protein